MDWELFAQWSLSIVSGGGFAGVVAYLLFKQLLDNKLRQELEDYKSGLSRQLADHKGALELQLKEHQKSIDQDLLEFSTQFSRLDQTRADAVIKIHGLMNEIDHLLAHVGNQKITEASKDIIEIAQTDLQNAMDLNRILFKEMLNHYLLLNDKIVTTISEWNKEINTLIINTSFHLKQFIQKNNLDQIDDFTVVKYVSNIIDEHSNKSIPILSEKRKILDPLFKEMLGLPTEK